MNAFFEWLSVLDWNMPRPIPYQSFAISWFHYLSLVLILFYAIYFSIRLRHASPKTIQQFVFITGILMALFEILRNLFFTYLGDGIYPWYIFPFQFCSTPIFVSLAVGFTKPGRFQQSLYAYLTSFTLLAGILVMAIPNDIYIDKVIINLQTTFQHGSMIVLGLVLMNINLKLHWKDMLGAIGIFSVFVVAAMGLNTLHNTLINEGVFNMFFINPEYGTSLPVFNVIYTLVPYPVFLLIYIGSFSVGAIFIQWFFQTIQQPLKSFFLHVLKPKHS